MLDQFEVKVWKAAELPTEWSRRKNAAEDEDDLVKKTVQSVINAVRQRGDDALLEFTEKFDKIKLTAQTLRVTAEEISSAYKAVTEKQIAALNLMKTKLGTAEKETIQQQPHKTSREGITVHTVMRPLESVGCYVPGGQAAYPSTLVMTAIPAKVAGVPRIVVCSPPTTKGTIDPLILVAADMCGVNEVYKVGGAQAVAALAYGTESIKAVKKIVGPGSKYVTMAKVLLSQEVAIDMPAGPSEILILADETANPKLVAADIISQAEHGADSVTGLVTTSDALAQEVRTELKRATALVERGNVVCNALSKYGFIIICTTIEEMVTLANAFAPEHLEIVTRSPEEIADKISTAGLILLGPYSPVALSDYAAGTNHVLPTGGFGYVFSGLSVLDFTRRISVIESTKDGLQKVRQSIHVLTDAERLPNHYKAVEARFDK